MELYKDKYGEKRSVKTTVANVHIEIQFNQQKSDNTTLQPYLDPGLQCLKIHRFVQYKPRKVFNIFIQSVVDATRASDKNSSSGVVGETMKLLGKSSNGYQIMDRSKHTMTKHLAEEKTHKTITNNSSRDSIL